MLADEGDVEAPAAGICATLVSHLLREVSEVVTETIHDQGLRLPSATLLLVGLHPTAVTYARSTIAAAKAAGVELNLQQLPALTPQAEVASIITQLNADPNCHGIVLQLPLPASLDAAALLSLVHDDKDVDCLKENSVRRSLVRAEPTVAPCIAAACEEVLRSLDILRPQKSSRGLVTPGPAVLLLGVPPLLAFPLEMCLEAAGCRVSCLAHDQEAASARNELHRADVLIIGARRPDIVAAQWVRSGCVLLDLGLASCSAPSPVNSLSPWEEHPELEGSVSPPSSASKAIATVERFAPADGEEGTCHSGSHYRVDGVARTSSNSSSNSSGSSSTMAGSSSAGADAPEEEGAARSATPEKLKAGTTYAHAPGLEPLTLPSSLHVAERPPFEPFQASEQRDVLCLCCSDGLSAMTAALRMRNLSHAALLQEGFLGVEQEMKLNPHGSPGFSLR